MGGMTNNPSPTDLLEIRSVDARRRQIRLVQVLFAGAAAVAAFALFSARRVAVGTAVASGSAPGITVVPVDDDTNPSSGDIFQQNAQDQSTASGAGTS